uniref:Putative trypsin-like serine protease n=1 Tax=Panstrongylus lignarius TaxID=156445 RepID=A0A224XQK8_9HEMI
MSILWFCAILQLAFSFIMIRNKNIFLNENQTEQMIEYSGNAENSFITFYKWNITAPPKHTIELYCDDIYLFKTNNCSKVSLIIYDDETREEFCELKDNLKKKSVKNKMEIKLWKLGFTTGNFRCQVRLVLPYLETIAEESGSSEYGLNEGPVSTTCPCGWSSKFIGKIVGGKETQINEYPFMVILVDRRSNARICGGTIITPLHVLTAAHCQWSPMSAIVGEHDFDQSSETNATVKIDVKYFVKHSQFSLNSLQYDIAIAILKQEISFNRDVGPVCMPSKKPDLGNQYIKALGWGVIDPDTKISSNVLREVNLKVINTETCSKSYNEMRLNSRSQFCTYAKKKDTCQGDSGGPLLWLDPELNRYTEIGIVSYGKKCATNAPGVNTDVYYFIDWIQSVVRASKDGKVCMREEN